MPATYRSASSAASDGDTSYTVARPTGTTAGDLLIACQISDWGNVSTLGTPTGGATWQLLAQRTAGGNPGINSKIWWKYAGGSEPSTYGFSQDGTAYGVAAIVCVQNPKPDTTPLVAQGGGTNSSTVVTPTITPAGVEDLDIRWACGTNTETSMVGKTWTPPSGWTQRTQIGSGESSAGAGGALATRALTSGEASGTRNYSCTETLDFWNGFAIIVASPPPPGGRAAVAPRGAVHRAASW